MKRKLTFRTVCTTLLWIAVAVVFGRQGDNDRIEAEVRSLTERVRALEKRPALTITVDKDGKAEVDGNHSERDGRDPDERGLADDAER